MEKARDVVIKIFKVLIKPEMKILPGHLAFYMFMAMIPLVALITTVAVALSISTDVIREAMTEYLPLSIIGILNSVTEGRGINFNIMVFYTSALLLASNGAYSMINSSNEIYKIKPRNIISRRMKAIVMTFIMLGLFIFLLVVPVFGDTLSSIIREITGDGTIVSFIRQMLVILKYPLIMLILFFGIKIMYIMGPDQEIPSKTTNKGAIFTSVLWILATEIYAFYAENFTSYDVFYGSISNILILMMWLYFLSYIYVLGLIINANDYRREIN